MGANEIDETALENQEQAFARAFHARDIALARNLYHPDVLYLSPTVRLFGWPARIEGVEKTLEFIQLTIANCPNISYRPVEKACLPNGGSAFVRIHFDWDQQATRLRSNYVVLYRYRDGVIAQQEIYYDPSSGVEVLSHTGGQGRRAGR